MPLNPLNPKNEMPRWITMEITISGFGHHLRDQKNDIFRHDIALIFKDRRGGLRAGPKNQVMIHDNYSDYIVIITITW